MPKSRIRRKTPYIAPPTKSTTKKAYSPRWVGPLMLVLFLLGIAWLVVFYMTGGEAPLLETLGNWNLAIGFGLIIAGFAVSTQWR